MSLCPEAELERTVPFASAFRPWVTDAAARVLPGRRVAPSAFADLTRSLLCQLSQHGALAALALYEDEGGGAYENFVADAPERLADAYPGFAHLASMVVEHWVQASSTLLARIEAGIDQLPGAPSTISAITPRAGDPHLGGHHAAILQPDHGDSVLLKPRSLACEVAFFACAEQSAGLLPGGPPWILDKGDHGWMEFVHQGPVTDPQQYWRSVGRMLALLQLIGATDLHQSNVIGTGLQLVPVDLECLATPEVVGRDGVGATRAGAFTRDSATATGLLPRALQVDGPVAVEWCGLTGRAGQLNGRWRAGWTGLGTDAIGRHRVPMKTPASTNIASDPGGAAVPLDLDAVLAGYAAEQHRWADGPDPARLVDGLRSRLILRPTSTYAQVISAVLQPDVLRSVAAVDEALNAVPDLHPDLVAALGEGGHDALVAAERAALARLDIPMAWAEGDDVILDDGTRLEGVAARSGADRVRTRHQRWQDPAWRRAEADLVALALEPAAARRSGGRPTERGERTGKAIDDSTSDRALAGAVAMAESLEADAVDLDDGRVGWVEAVPQGHSGRLLAVLAPAGLYHGGEGIAAFLARLALTTGDQRWADLALRALPPAPDPADTPVSFTSGWSGWAWAASVASEALGDTSLTKEARSLVLDSQTDLAVDPLDPLDLIGGWSGPLAALTSVARRTGSGDVAEVATDLGRSVAEAATTQLDHPTKVHKLTRLGAAHGSPGVTLALGSAVDVGGDPRTGGVFEQLVALEDARIARRDGIGGRIDQGRRGRAASRTWCWGVAGYLVACARPWFDDHDRGASEAVSFATLAAGKRPLDHACCGSAGHLEAAVASRDTLDLPGAAALVDDLVEHLATDPLTFHERSTFDSPGLFRGRAGVGLALLRAHDPSTPSALAVS